MGLRQTVEDHSLQSTRSKDLGSILFLAFISVASERVMAILVTLAANTRGASNSWIGILTGTPSLTLVLAMIPCTWYVAAWRRRTVLAIGTGLQGAAVLGQGIVTNLSWMLLPQVVLGLGLAIFLPAYLSYFASLVVGDTANEMHGRRAAVNGAALMVAPVGGTFLAQHLGYRGGFLLVGSLTLLSAVVPLFLMGPAARPSVLRRTLSDFGRNLHNARAMFRRPAFQIMLVLNATSATLFGQVGGPFLTLYIRSLGFGEVAVGSFLSLQALSDTTLRFMFGRIASRIRPIYLLALSIMGGGALYLLVPVISKALFLGVLLLMIGVVASPRNPAGIGITSELFSTEERDLGMALLLMVSSVVTWLFAPALGALGDVAGLPAIFIVGGCLAMGLTGTLTLVGRGAALRNDASSEMMEFWHGNAKRG
jgi:predicted MFS family arabinose efflux permease